VRFTKIGLVALLVVALSMLVVYGASNREQKLEFKIPDTSNVEVNSNRHTQLEKQSNTVKSIVDLNGFEKKMENNTLEVWFNNKTASIRIVDKQRRYIWGTVGIEQPDNLNKEWFAMANSLCTIDYYNEKNAKTRISLSSLDIDKKYAWSNDDLECNMNLNKLGISLTFTMELKEDHLNFAVKKGSLVEKGKNKIESIYFIPFLGTTQEDQIDGYMFVPDGPGALIRYGKANNYTSGFSKKVYGGDIGIDSVEQPSDLMANRSNDYLVEEPQISMPVYGIVHGDNQNGVFAVIEEGQEFSTILANVSGITTNYNWVTARFDYRQDYMHPINKAGTGILMPQDETNAVNPKISFYFLTGKDANYSSMAVLYRGLLEQQGILKKERNDKTVPIQLNVVGSDIRKGLLYNPLTVFTKAKETEDILNKLKTIGITNVSMVYEGWQKGGINGSDYGTLSFESKVGNKSDFEQLKNDVEATGGRFYLSLNPITGNKDQINKAGEGAVTLSEAYAKYTRADTELMYYEDYVTKPSVATKLLINSKKKLLDFNFAYDNIGYRLYADYTRNHYVYRQETQKEFINALATVAKGGVALDRPNEYLWSNTSEYFDIPMVSSQYLFETDTVPFLQIVLKGSMDYYAPFTNQGFYSQNSILKMIEYGSYPSFIVAAAENYKFANTPLVDLFSVNFQDWEGTIEDVYSQVSKALAAVEGAKIKEHRMVAAGVARVTYDNGTAIYVNYNSTQSEVDGITVPALGFTVKGR
jgi:hypothetical protein